MISSAIWFSLWFSSVLAPPFFNTNHRLSGETNFTLITSQLQSRRNRTITDIHPYHFDIKAYRSTWKFVDKNTMRVRFRLYDSLLKSIVATRFLVRHLRTNHIRTYDEPHEIINSTLTLYLHNMNHGRHIVCLLLYRSKLMLSPKCVFCQDIIYNFHKYGQHDMDVEEYGNTFVFLLTQYSIVLGILCILQLVHAGRKRRFLKAVYQKANALRTLMSEHHHHHHHRSHEHKSPRDMNPQTNALEYLIYNFNRNALYNIDGTYRPTTTSGDDDDDNSPIPEYDKYLKIPRRLSRHSITPFLRHRRLSIKVDPDEEIFDENDFDTRSCEDQSISYKSVSHILEENKPWITKFTDNGTIQHAILSSSESSRVRLSTDVANV